ncbi:hypothetical protein [Trabulsiella odontotermitis]|uniref:hypothetical protein n=1 Tax=Trabulsiella odontotermitis TaxID=379893 RepID=UPI0006763BE9|nr:hypothetical protein [Trabulsiella odontotermitis]KNC89898.1 hypothetical protein GM30_06010 [Trabulsiella odontotermitis]
MEKHELLYGVQSGDVIHRDFSVRLPVIRDTIDALRLTHEACGTTEGAAANMYYKVTVMALVLTSLGSLAKEDITPELLLDALNDEDFDIIDAQIEAVKKKRMPSKSDSPDTELLSSPSGDTASQNGK